MPDRDEGYQVKLRRLTMEDHHVVAIIAAIILYSKPPVGRAINDPDIKRSFDEARQFLGKATEQQKA